MKSPTKLLITFGVVGTLTLSAFDAEAQRVRTFGDDGDGGQSSQVVVPGAPAPEQEPQEPQIIQQEPAPEESDEGDAPPTSHSIRMHSPTSQGAQSAAPELLSAEHTELYRGIIPGKRNEVEHLSEIKKRGSADRSPNPITWVGFQPEDDRTRVFFQAPRPVQYQVQGAPRDGELVVIFENAEIPKANFSRFIDTSFFNRAVTRIETTETRDGNVKVTLKMRRNLEPEISTDGEYLFFDFPHRAGDSGDDA